jgi:hypothetical protein
MGTEYVVEKCKLKGGLEGLARAWADGAPVEIITPLTPQLAEEGGMIMRGFGSGSVRGFAVGARRSLMGRWRLEVRLPLFASRVDWALAFRLIGLAVERGGKLSEEGPQGLRPKDLTEQTAHKMALEGYRAGSRVLAEHRQDGEAELSSLPNGLYELHLDVPEAVRALESESEAFALEEALAGRAERLERSACPMTAFKTPGGGTGVLWVADAPALVSAELECVALAPIHGVGEDGAPLEPRVLALEDLRQQLGERAEIVQSDPTVWRLAPLDLEDETDRALFEEMWAEAAAFSQWSSAWGAQI